MLDIEYLIHRVAIDFSREASEEDIRYSLRIQFQLDDDIIFLLICAGRILAIDWANNSEEEEITKPDNIVLNKK